MANTNNNNRTTGNLNALIESGFDAFNNLWDVDIKVPEAIGGELLLGDQGEISLRTSEFTPPKFSLKTYKIAYKGIELERLSSTLEYKDNRELKLKFRMDGEYKLLDILQKWKQLYYNPSGDGNIRFGMYSKNKDSATSSRSPYGTITVKAYQSVNAGKGLTLNELVSEGDGNNLVAKVWKFEHVVLLDVDVSNYSREGDSKAQEVECMFIYGAVTEPGAVEANGLT